MMTLSRCSLLLSLLALPVLSQTDGWTSLFDGKSLDGWKAGGNPDSFKVVNGSIAADGPRSHLYHNGDFKNFELKLDAMTRPGANSGVYFHTRYQPDGFPSKGFEVQICNTCTGEGSYRERKKTGSLYAVRNVYKVFAKDDEWFPMHILVRGKQAQVRVNGMLLVDWIEPDPPVIEEEFAGRVLDRGAFALQCHDTGSKAFFKNIQVRRLPDDIATAERPVADDIYRQLQRLGSRNMPLVDYHVHLKSGFTLEDALRESRRLGIQYGIAINCGMNFAVHDDAGVRQFLDSMKGQPAFVGLQGEGREWVKLVSKETVARFDYVFTDAMTFTDDNGKRMRLWIKDEVGEIKDKQQFMETYVNRILGVLNHEPIDIYANPTFLPDSIAAEYDQLWTPERMQKVIDAAKKNDVAIEINNRYRLPSATFIILAKKAGVKFSFGTNNADARVGRLEYSLEMVNQCGLTWQDMFVPKPEGEKPVQRRGM